MDAAPDDEIDLQELAIRLIRYFRKNFRFVSLWSVAGIIVGVVGWFTVPKIYESKMILQSDILTESYSERLTEILNSLIKEENLTGLASKLSLSEEEAKKVKKIEIESVRQDKVAEKSEATTFIITARIGDRNFLPKLQDGLINFLRSNEFVKIRVRQREDMLKTMIAKVGDEIESLDSLKKRLFEGKRVYGNAAEMLLIDPTSIYTKILDLTSQRIAFQNSLELVNSIQLIEGFTVFDKPTFPKLSWMLAGGFLLGLFVAVCVLTFEQLYKMS